MSGPRVGFRRFGKTAMPLKRKKLFAILHCYTQVINPWGSNHREDGVAGPCIAGQSENITMHLINKEPLANLLSILEKE